MNHTLVPCSNDYLLVSSYCIYACRHAMAEKVTKLTRKRELEREARQTESGVQKKARLEMATNNFVEGMRLEAHDLENLSLLCVAHIIQVQGDTIKLHFDGWGSRYDYSCKRNCLLIHPVGWCERSSRPPVTPPKGYEEKFVWNQYLLENECLAAPEHLFTPSQRRSTHFFEKMKLEAKDRYNSKIYVATISELRYPCHNGVHNKQELHITFDGKEDHDYWCESEDSDIHQVGWCKKNGIKLHNYLDFRWSEYLSETDAEAATSCLFTKEQGGDKEEKYVQGEEEDNESENESENEH